MKLAEFTNPAPSKKIELLVYSNSSFKTGNNSFCGHFPLPLWASLSDGLFF